MHALIQDYVSRVADQNPQQPAITFKQQRFTYGELDALSNQLAELFRESGCHRGDRIAFCIPKSPQAIITMLGVLKADCVYVPIDPDCPPARIAKVFDACRPNWVIAGKSSAKLIDEVLADPEFSSIKVGCLDNECVATTNNYQCQFCFADLARFSSERHAYANRPSDPAHILFTSGSTGVPKGVVITHQNVMSFVDWGVDYFGMNSTDRVSGHAPLHFDLSTFDTYGAFAAGAELYPVAPELNLLPHKLVEFIRASELTQWFSVPSILNYLAKFDSVDFGDFPTLRRLMWCGEVLPTPTLIYLMRRLESIQFTNLYGPTEATIASSFFTVESCPERQTDSIPIGVGCDGEQLLVLDEQLKSVPPGEIGHLYLGGVGLSPGYWRDQEKTDAVFVRHPETGERIYKTGDLAKWNAAGQVEFIGRADTQIKSRGYRIELGEIEAGLSALKCLGESAVVAIDTEGFENKLICCAYVPAKESATEVLVRDLKKQLGEHVPKYMIPSLWMDFAQLPKNANGKIDRPRLRELFAQTQVSDKSQPDVAPGESVASNGSIEQSLPAESASH